MTTTSPEPATPASEPEGSRHRELRSALSQLPRARPDLTRGGLQVDEVPAALDRTHHPTEAVRPVSVEAALQWDAALWHQGWNR